MKCLYKGFRIAVERRRDKSIQYEVSKVLHNGHIRIYYQSFVEADGDIRQMIKNCKELTDNILLEASK